jgi:hypothetical protein
VYATCRCFGWIDALIVACTVSCDCVITAIIIAASLSTGKNISRHNTWNLRGGMIYICSTQLSVYNVHCTCTCMYMYLHVHVHVALPHYMYMYMYMHSFQMVLPFGIPGLGTWCACTQCVLYVHVHVGGCLPLYMCACAFVYLYGLLVANTSHFICNFSLHPHPLSLSASPSPHFRVGRDARQCPSLQGGLCVEEEHYGGASQERYSWSNQKPPIN